MPTPPRILMDRMPHHMVLQGKFQVFYNNADTETFINFLHNGSRQFRFQIWGYCLLPNRVHLLLEPLDSANNISHFAKRICEKYAQYYNARHDVYGSVWKSRFRCSVLQAPNYVILCQQYLMQLHQERNPTDSIIDVPLKHLNIFKPEQVSQISIKQFQIIQNAWKRNKPLGDEGFLKKIERETGVRIVPRKPGRPRIKPVQKSLGMGPMVLPQ